MVLMLHAGIRSTWGWTVSWSSWLGVDVFFVLSGFLITMLLLQEVDRRGTIRLGAFYVRRFLRLYPMIFVVLVFSAFTALLLPETDRMHTTHFGAVSIALYFTNWLEIAKGSDWTLGVFGHLWSLAIEEQFYLVWPIVVLASIKLGSRRVGPFLAARGRRRRRGDRPHHRLARRQDLGHRHREPPGPDCTHRPRRPLLVPLDVHPQRRPADRMRARRARREPARSMAHRLEARIGAVTGWDDRQLRRYARRVIGGLGLVGAVVVEGIANGNHHHVYPEFLIGVGLPLFEVAVGLVIVNPSSTTAGSWPPSWRGSPWCGSVGARTRSTSSTDLHRRDGQDLPRYTASARPRRRRDDRRGRALVPLLRGADPAPQEPLRCGTRGARNGTHDRALADVAREGA